MTYKVTMKNGETIEVDRFDGGGVSLVGDDKGRYEVHGRTKRPRSHGFLFCEYQDSIESVVDADGNEYFNYGNPLFPGHPGGR